MDFWLISGFGQSILRMPGNGIEIGNPDPNKIGIQFFLNPLNVHVTIDSPFLTRFKLSEYFLNFHFLKNDRVAEIRIRRGPLRVGSKAGAVPYPDSIINSRTPRLQTSQAAS